MSKYQQAEVLKIEGVIVVPEDYRGEANIILPDEIVLECARRYELCRPKFRVLDPMCGVGTIPRVINTQGGICDGVEIDDARYETAVKSAGGSHIFRGDYRSTSLPFLLYDCIFTSLPFVWFKDSQTAEAVNSNYAQRFREILMPDGFILLDSMPLVQRLGKGWPVAQLQSEYLTKNGFRLNEIIAFDNKQHLDLDTRSVIMKFSVL